MTKQEKAGVRRLLRSMKKAASNYAAANAAGGMRREATPTRKPKLGQLVADLNGMRPGAILGTMAALRLAARMRRGQAR